MECVTIIDNVRCAVELRGKKFCSFKQKTNPKEKPGDQKFPGRPEVTTYPERGMEYNLMQVYFYSGAPKFGGVVKGLTASNSKWHDKWTEVALWGTADALQFDLG